MNIILFTAVNSLFGYAQRFYLLGFAPENFCRCRPEFGFTAFKRKLYFINLYHNLSSYFISIHLQADPTPTPIGD